MSGLRSMTKGIHVTPCATLQPAKNGLNITEEMALLEPLFRGVKKIGEMIRQWHFCHFPLIRKSDSMG